MQYCAKFNTTTRRGLVSKIDVALFWSQLAKDDAFFRGTAYPTILFFSIKYAEQLSGGFRKKKKLAGVNSIVTNSERCK